MSFSRWRPSRTVHVSSPRLRVILAKLAGRLDLSDLPRSDIRTLARADKTTLIGSGSSKNRAHRLIASAKRVLHKS